MFSLGTDSPRQRVQELADQYGLTIDPDAKIRELDVGEQQRVEILKVLYRDTDLLILDEPTAVLTPTEVDKMFTTLRQLADNGLSIIFITHKLGEVKAITDRVSILRDGQKINTVATDDVTESDLAEMMVGREVLFSLEKDAVSTGDPILSGQNIHAEDQRGVEILSGIDFTIREGEIVGIAGVSGNGQKELAECLVGIRNVTDGQINVRDNDLTNAHSRQFVNQGISFIPEDRHKYGCAPELSVMHNAGMKDYHEDKFTNHGFIDYNEMAEYADQFVDLYDGRGITDVEAGAAGVVAGGK
jgi:simple sugar transport system ATP-binding protein